MTEIQNHIFLSFLIITLATGLVALVLSIIIFKKKNELFKNYVPAFGIFTLNVFSNSVAAYLVTNIPSVRFDLILTFFFMGAFLIILLMLLMTRLVNNILSLPFAKKFNIFFLVLFITEILLFSYGIFFGSTTIVMDTKTLEYSLINKIVLCINLIPILYSAAVILIYNKNIADIRFRKMFKSLFISLLIFFPGVIFAMRHKIGTLHFQYQMIDNYIFASILYLAWSVVSIYHFIQYYLYDPRDLASTKISETSVIEYGITTRERDIIRLIANGHSNSDIGEELSISISTVKSHLHNIFGKTGARNRTELISFLMFEK